MNTTTKKALDRLQVAIGRLEARHAEAIPAPQVTAEIAAIRGMVDEAISLLANGAGQGTGPAEAKKSTAKARRGKASQDEANRGEANGSAVSRGEASRGEANRGEASRGEAGLDEASQGTANQEASG